MGIQKSRVIASVFVLFCAAYLVIAAEADEVDVTGKRGRIKRGLREGAEKEIEESRGKVEDELRAKALGCFWRPEQIEKVRSYLNAPWNEDAAEYLLSVVKHSVYGEDFLRIRVDPGTVIPHVLDLLAYVHTNYEDEKLRKTIAEGFDSLFVSLREVGDEDKSGSLVLTDALYWSVVNHGSAALLGPGFWEGMKAAEDTLVWLMLLEKVVDESALKKLQGMRGEITDKDAAKRLDKAVTNIKNRLDGKPPVQTEMEKLLYDHSSEESEDKPTEDRQ